MDFANYSKFIAIVLKRFETLDGDQLKIPFIAQRISELKKKLTILRQITGEEDDADLHMERFQRNSIRDFPLQAYQRLYKLGTKFTSRNARREKSHLSFKSSEERQLSKVAKAGNLFLKRFRSLIPKDQTSLERDDADADADLPLGEFRPNLPYNQSSYEWDDADADLLLGGFRPSLLKNQTSYELSLKRSQHIPWYQRNKEWQNGGLVTCFVYCTLYPEGHNIVREELINQWMAEDLLQPAVGEELEDAGNRYFKEMLSGGVFQNPIFAFGGTLTDDEAVVYSCVMHPRAYDAARRLSQELVSLFRYGDKYSTGTSAKYVSYQDTLHDGEIWKSISLKPIITTCMSFGHPRRFYNPLSSRQQAGELSVLNLQLDVYQPNEAKMLISDILHGSLYNLRFLSLLVDSFSESGKDISHPVELFGFHNLQTLALDKSLEVKPYDFRIRYMRKLRHLYLTTRDTALDLSDSNLRILQLSHCRILRSLSADIESLRYLRALRIFHCPQLVYLPDNFNVPGLQELVIHSCPRLDLANGTTAGMLPKLQYLEIIGLHRLVEFPTWFQSMIMGGKRGSTPTSLRYIIIADCKRLRNIENVVMYQNSLGKVYIYRCPKLMALPKKIPQHLTDLHIKDCPVLTALYETGSYEWNSISHIQHIVFDGQTTYRQKERVPSNISVDRTSGSPTDSDFRPTIPFFHLNSKMRQGAQNSLQGMIILPDYSRWHIIRPVLTLVFRLKAMVRETIIRQQIALEEMKLHFCHFPYGYELERDTIVQLWMARGLLQNTPTKRIKENMEDVGIRYFDMMEQEKFFLSTTIDILSGKQKYVANPEKVKLLLEKMPPMVDAKNLSARFENEVEVADGSSSSWHLTVVSNIIDDRAFHTLKQFKELKTLLFVRNYGSSLTKIPPDLFLALRKLESLDLSGSHISELPSSIGYVTELHYLDLSYTLIEELPESLGCLIQLQTLRLRGCKHLFSLPDSMSLLVSLRHLDFDVLGQLTSMPRGLSALKELQTLSAFIVGKGEGFGIKELHELKNITGSFSISGLEEVCPRDMKYCLWNKRRLTKLQLRWNPKKQANRPSTSTEGQLDLPSEILKKLDPSLSLEELQVLHFPGSTLPNWLGYVSFGELVRIRFLRCENIKLDIGLGKLRNLRYLDITEMNEVTKIEHSLYGDIRAPFPLLKEFIVCGMLRLESWAAINNCDFPSLTKFTIRKCPKLSELPFSTLPVSLEYLEISDCTALKSLTDGKLSTSLKSVVIEDCPLLKERCSRNGADWDKIKHAEIISIDLDYMHYTEAISKTTADSNSENEDDDQETEVSENTMSSQLE